MRQISLALLCITLVSSRASAIEPIVLEDYLSAGCQSGCDDRFTGCGDCQPWEQPCGREDSYWFADTRAVYLKRGELDSTPIMNNNANTATELRGSDFDLDFAPGVDVRLGRTLEFAPNASRAAIRYLGVYDWNDSFSRTLPNGNNVLFVNNPFGNNASQQWLMEYESQLQSLEMNVYRDNCRVSWFGGLRYLRLKERMDLNFDVAAVAQVGDYVTRVDNHLLGGQIGSNIRLLERRRFQIEAGLMGGLFVNFADNSTVYTETVSGDIFEAHDNTAKLALVTEASLDTTFEITRRISIVAGLSFLWLEGVAISADQIRSQSIQGVNVFFPGGGDGIDADGRAIYYGGNLGLVIKI